MSPGLIEEPVFFPSGGHTLAGIVTIPPNPIGRTAIIPWGAGAFPSSARNQFRTRLAREVGELGYHAFRFDYPGVGESEGTYRTPTMAQPFADEVVAASEWLTTQGLNRHVMVANCLGAWSVLKAAHRLPDLEGLISYNCPVRRDHEEVRVQEAGLQWWVSRIARLRWRNLLSRHHRERYSRLVKTKAAAVTGVGVADASHFNRQVEILVRASVPMMFIYGDDGFRGDFEDAVANGLGPVLASAGPATRALLIPHRVEGFPTVGVQEQLLEATLSWLTEILSDRAVETTGPQ